MDDSYQHTKAFNKISMEIIGPMTTTHMENNNILMT